MEDSHARPTGEEDLVESNQKFFRGDWLTGFQSSPGPEPNQKHFFTVFLALETFRSMLFKELDQLRQLQLRPRQFPTD